MNEQIFVIKNFRLSVKDYLNYLLFDASKDKKVIKTRFRNRIIFIALFLSVFIYINLKSFDIIFSLFFIPFVITMFLVREIIVRNDYVKRFENYIRNQQNEHTNTSSEITFTKSFLLIEESNSESKVSYKDFNEIIEINDYIFIKILGRSVLIINKKLDNLKILTEHLKNISLEDNIPYQLDLNWKWK